MCKIIASAFVTLDGVAEAPGSGDTTLPDYRGWSEPYMTDEMGQLIMSQMDATDALLLGRKTYEGFAAFWSQMPADDLFAGRMNGMTKYVVSNTLTQVDWQNSRLVQGDFVTEINRLKQQPCNRLSITGSIGLIQSLIRHHLLDELQLSLCPVVLGTGKRLFEPGQDRHAFELADTRTFSTGMVLLTYHPAVRPA